MIVLDDEIMGISRALNAATDAGDDVAPLVRAWLDCFERQTEALRRQQAPLPALGMVALRHAAGCLCSACAGAPGQD